MSYDQISAGIGEIFANLKNSAVEFVPKLITAFILILIGFLVARLLRALVRRLIRNLGKVVPGTSVERRLNPERMETTARLLSNTLFWIVLFFFVTAGTEILGLPVLTTWLGGIAGYLPKILVAIIIAATGIIGGRLIYDIVNTGAAGISYGGVLAKLAQYSISVVSILIAIDHLGVDITLLTSLIVVMLAASLFGAGLAFGLGAKTSASNILASYYLQKMYKVGQTVRIGSTEGEIIEITPTAVILQSPAGQTYIPAKQFNESDSLLLRKGHKDGQ